MNRDPSRAESNQAYPDPETFARIAAEFERLRDVHGPELSAALAALEERDPAVGAEVRRLLAHHQTADVLDTPDRALDAKEVAAALDVEAAEEGGGGPAAPAEIGPWRLLEAIGRGGMGTVHLAQRADGEFEQKVAIKLLRASAHDDDLVRRFRAERRILAGLTHPNIATLIDGGSTEDGRPYVVMEYVEGEDLVAFAKHSDLSLRARLELLVKVCGAVSHAHRNLVVHRDLKPSNVLVTAAGEPKLLDFGIAKLLASDADEAQSLALTGAGTMLLTPEYASPEQVRGETITTATDVYALGLLLYELLAGQRAQVLPSRSYRDLERVVCDTDPTPPSAVLGAREGRRLRDELDTIVAQAMQKEPARRYASAAALADDLQRYLDGLPVQARRDTSLYRLTKFVRRHRFGVAAAAVVVALLGYTVVTTELHARDIAEERDIAKTERETARRERDNANRERVIANQQREIATSAQAQAERERDTARRETAIANQISNFLVGLYRMAEPDPFRANQVRARDLLDRGSRAIRDELAAGPLVRARLMVAMGRAYLSMGLFDEARGLLQEGDALAREHGATGAILADNAIELGRLHVAVGEYTTAQGLVEAALAGSEAAGDREAVGRALLQLADLQREVGRTPESLETLDRAERIVRETRGALDEGYAMYLVIKATTQYEMADYDAALASLHEAESIRRKLFGPDHPVHARTLRSLGRVLRARGEYAESKVAFEKALAFNRQVSGEQHPDVDADLFELALTLEDSGDFDGALELLNEVLERDRARSGSDVHVALDLGQIAGVLSSQGEFEKAEPLYLEAIELQRRALPPNHPELATTLSNLGVLYHRMRRYDEIDALYDEVLKIRLAVFPEDHPHVLTTRNMIANQFYARRKFAEAEEQYRAILAARERELGRHPQTAGSYYSVAVALGAQGKFEESRPFAETSLEMYREFLPPDHMDLTRPMSMLGKLAMGRSELPLAEQHFREVLRIRTAALRSDHPALIAIDTQLGVCLTRQARFAEAEEVLLRAIGRAPGDAGPQRRDLDRARGACIALYHAWGKPEKAAALR